MNHSLTVGRHRARRARVTRDHRIKSPTGGLSTTIAAKRVQQNPTGNPLSFNRLTDVCFAEEY